MQQHGGQRALLQTLRSGQRSIEPLHKLLLQRAPVGDRANLFDGDEHALNFGQVCLILLAEGILQCCFGAGAARDGQVEFQAAVTPLCQGGLNIGIVRRDWQATDRFC